MAMAARRERGLLDPDAAAGRVAVRPPHLRASASDGDLEEGVSGEASSLAGTQELGNLTVIYDDNRISIEDDTDIAFTEDVADALRGLRLARPDRRLDPRRHRVRRGRAGAVRRDPQAAEAVTDKPSFIVLHTIIAWPAPNAQNTGKAHGSALGADEVAATKKVLGFDPEQTFEVADDVLAHTRGAVERGKARAGRVGHGVRRAGPAQAPTDAALLRAAADPRACPTAGTTRCPTFAGRREGRRHPRGLRRR